MLDWVAISSSRGFLLEGIFPTQGLNLGLVHCTFFTVLAKAVINSVLGAYPHMEAFF